MIVTLEIDNSMNKEIEDGAYYVLVAVPKRNKKLPIMMAYKLKGFTFSHTLHFWFAQSGDKLQSNFRHWKARKSNLAHAKRHLEKELLRVTVTNLPNNYRIDLGLCQIQNGCLALLTADIDALSRQNHGR